VEWGYNRDGDRLPQLNLAMYVGYESRLPVYYETYPGSIVDKSRLRYMMEHNRDLDIEAVCFVMDRGFPTTANMEYMRSEGHSFIAAVENRTKAFKAAIAEKGPGMVISENRLDDFTVFGTSVKGYYYGILSTLHIYFDHGRLHDQTNDIYTKIKNEEEELKQKISLSNNEIKKYKKHFIINKNKDGESFSWSRNHKAITEFMKDCGYFCILTNSELSSRDVYLIYKNRGIIEESFDEIKNYIDMKRLRTHNDGTTDGKIFCAFLCLIIRLYLQKTLSEWMREHKFTTKRVLRDIGKIQAIIGKNGARVLNPLTKKQREILAAFGATEDDVKNYLEASTS
jgi:transposase